MSADGMGGVEWGGWETQIGLGGLEETKRECRKAGLKFSELAFFTMLCLAFRMPRSARDKFGSWECPPQLHLGHWQNNRQTGVYRRVVLQPCR